MCVLAVGELSNERAGKAGFGGRSERRICQIIGQSVGGSVGESMTDDHL